MRWAYFCLSTGLSQEQTKQLLNNQPITFTGKLYSKEHNKYFDLTEAKVSFIKDSQTSRYVLTVNNTPIQTWFKAENSRLMQNLGVSENTERKGRKV
ncbi:hypothetical protein D0T66_16275 [Dysgonomonas sp. 25]|nr:hypothetical protein [Dysgonomonas sp. 25]